MPVSESSIVNNSSILLWIIVLCVSIAELRYVHWDVSTVILLLVLFSCLYTVQRSCQQIEKTLQASQAVSANVLRNSRVLFAEVALVVIVSLCIALMHARGAYLKTAAITAEQQTRVAGPIRPMSSNNPAGYSTTKRNSL